MTDYAIYNIKTGAIRCIFSGPDDKSARLQCSHEEHFIKGATDDSEEYVDVSSGRIKPRSELTPSLKTNTGNVTIKNLPKGTMVHCEGHSEKSEGSATIEIDEPGTYAIHLDPPAAYKPKTLEIDIP